MARNSVGEVIGDGSYSSGRPRYERTALISVEFEAFIDPVGIVCEMNTVVRDKSEGKLGSKQAQATFSVQAMAEQATTSDNAHGGTHETVIPPQELLLIIFIHG